jgi:hypothetical protein
LPKVFDKVFRQVWERYILLLSHWMPPFQVSGLVRLGGTFKAFRQAVILPYFQPLLALGTVFQPWPTLT